LELKHQKKLRLQKYLASNLCRLKKAQSPKQKEISLEKINVNQKKADPCSSKDRLEELKESMKQKQEQRASLQKQTNEELKKIKNQTPLFQKFERKGAFFNNV
jgi:hypothetical protein